MRIFRKLPYISCIIASLIILVISIIGITAPKIEMLETKGVIVNIKEYIDPIDDTNSYTTYIDYSIGKEKYKNVEYGAYDSKMKVGDQVIVMYDPNNHTHIEAPNADRVPYITGGASLVSLVVFTVLLIKS